MEQETEVKELWCSGCLCKHPVSAFGVNRSTKRGYQTACRAAQAKYNWKHYAENRQAILERVAAYQRTGKGGAVHAKANAKYHVANRQAIRERHAKYQAELRRQAFEIIGNVCAWELLGGCQGELEADHIVPVKRRHKTGYTSHSTPLYLWIGDNRTEAKKLCQPLCNSHNCFKNDQSEVDAQAAWVKKYPVLFLMTVAAHLEEAGVLDLQRAA